MGRMAQERVSRTRVKRDHRSFRKPWGVQWGTRWWDAGLGFQGRNPPSSLSPSDTWRNPLFFHL